MTMFDPGGNKGSPYCYTSTSTLESWCKMFVVIQRVNDYKICQNVPIPSEKLTSVQVLRFFSPLTCSHIVVLQ